MTKPSAILVSYVNLKKFIAARGEPCYRSWVMDSGAYSVLNSGVTIDLNDYIACCRFMLENDPLLEHVFALDVIGDPEATARNAEEMTNAGIPAVPAFHFGSPWHYLEDLAKRYEKIALGGLVARGERTLPWQHRLEFCEQAFARVWPKWIHGFGCADKRLLTKVPFAQVDATSWLYGCAKYGNLKMGHGIGPANRRTESVLPKESANPEAFRAAARTQVEWHRQLEDDVRRLFGPTLAKAGLGRFELRLVVSGSDIEHIRGA